MTEQKKALLLKQPKISMRFLSRNTYRITVPLLRKSVTTHENLKLQTQKNISECEKGVSCQSLTKVIDFWRGAQASRLLKAVNNMVRMGGVRAMEPVSIRRGRP